MSTTPTDLHFSYLPTFSSVKVTDLVESNFLDTKTVTKGNLTLCTCNETDHDHLLPYFYTNDGILARYRLKGMKQEAQKLESTFSQLKAQFVSGQSLSMLPPGKAKYFPAHVSASLEENDWTFVLRMG